MAKRQFKVVLAPASGSTLVETVTANGMSTGDILKLKNRKMKIGYRNVMKDPNRFPTTHMADPRHATLILRNGVGKDDEVTFFCFESFVITLARDPDIVEETDGPDTPFLKKATNTPISSDTATLNTAANPPLNEQYLAGPYKATDDADKQGFWKYSITTTVNNYTLDPDIVTE